MQPAGPSSWRPTTDDMPPGSPCRSPVCWCGRSLDSAVEPRAPQSQRNCGVTIVISSIERASVGISVCSALRSVCARKTRHDGHTSGSRSPPTLLTDPGSCPRASLRAGTDGPDDRLVGRFQVPRVGSSAKRASAAILGGYPSKRTADECARLYRPATLVALRIGPETYETAALPLSYVGASASIGDDFKQQLFPRSSPNGPDVRFVEHNARIADDCEHAAQPGDPWADA